MPSTMPGTISGSNNRLFTASRPANRPRTRQTAAGTPMARPIDVATTATCRLRRNPETNLSLPGTARNHFSEWPSGGNDGISCAKNASQITKNIGSRIYVSDTPAAVRSARRPTTRDEVHPGTTVKIASLRAPQIKRLLIQPVRSSTGSLIQTVLMQDPCLHDQREMFALIAKQRKVFQRIAVDQDGVGEGACLQRTHSARHAQHLGADRGRRADDLDRRDDLLADGE